ncbi:unnamed protein product [Prorocentrum cordatum]|uniref:Uncharacterized protein n=1 Tax=Prorocentrum cordatum TaxID=2364126 RepID=A0ABN9XI07_9DINO|nr:unnamed protein product [Polarella glacialis]
MGVPRGVQVTPVDPRASRSSRLVAVSAPAAEVAAADRAQVGDMFEHDCRSLLPPEARRIFTPCLSGLNPRAMFEASVIKAIVVSHCGIATNSERPSGRAVRKTSPPHPESKTVQMS